MVNVSVSKTENYNSSGYDWQIYIPSKNRMISISNIVSPQKENSTRVCWNPINSFVQDGQLIEPPSVDINTISGYVAYINN